MAYYACVLQFCTAGVPSLVTALLTESNMFGRLFATFVLANLFFQSPLNARVWPVVETGYELVWMNVELSVLISLLMTAPAPVDTVRPVSCSELEETMVAVRYARNHFGQIQAQVSRLADLERAARVVPDLYPRLAEVSASYSLNFAEAHQFLKSLQEHTC